MSVIRGTERDLAFRIRHSLCISTGGSTHTGWSLNALKVMNCDLRGKRSSARVPRANELFKNWPVRELAVHKNWAE